MAQNPMDRRRFIKLTAITGTTAALTACGNPENQIVRFIPEEDLTPGIATYKPSICPLCSAGCGVIARVMEGDAEVFRKGQPGVIKMGLAKKLEGNPDDAISQGRLCARGQAAIQVTYHPDRLDKPKKRTGERGSGQFADITWEEALKELTAKLNELAAANDQASLALLTKPRRGARLELLADWLQRFGAKPPIAHEFFSDEVLRRANATAFGSHQLPTFDLENARYVISFGADFLGTWNSVVAHSAAFGRMKQKAGARPKFVHVDARLSQTAANADEFVACKPGTEGVLALAIAREYDHTQAAEKTGVRPETIERLATEFAAHGPSVAIIGGTPLAHSNGLFHAQAVNRLNQVAKAPGQPGGISFTPDSRAVATRSIKALLDAAPKVLLIDDANPIFSSPNAMKVADALKRVPFIVSFGSFVDETSVHADLILPDHSFLESWVEAAPESGSLKGAPSKFGPVMKPLYDTRSTPDLLLEVGRGLAKPIAGLPGTFEEYLNQAPGQRANGPTGRQANGPTGQQANGPTGHQAIRPSNPQAPKPSSPLAWVEPVFDGDASQYPFHFLPYPSQSFYDGSLAHLPWLQELPDPMTSGMWCSWVEINEKKAHELGIAQGDLIEVTSTQGTLRAPAFLNPGIAPDAVAMPVGQGHTNFTRYASNRGSNPIAILAPATVGDTGELAWAATRVKIARVGGPDQSLILFAGATRERPEELHGRGEAHE